MIGLQILQEIRDQLKQCRAVSSEREFCEQWLGKSECYMRTLKYGDLTPSDDALMTCAASCIGTHVNFATAHMRIMCIGLRCLSACVSGA